MFRRSIIATIAATVLASCNDTARSDEITSPQVTELSLGQTAESCIPRSGWHRHVSPDGNVIVLLGSDSTTYLLNKSDAPVVKLSGLIPLGWGSSPVRLWLSDEAGDVWVWRDGQVSRAPDLSQSVRRAVSEGTFGFLPPWDLVASGHGAAVYSSRSGTDLAIVDLRSGTVSRLEVGKTWGSHRGASLVQVGRARNGDPHIFVNHSKLLDDGMDVINRLEIFATDGRLIRSAQIVGRQVDFPPRPIEDGVLVVALRGQTRCLHVIRSDGRIEPVASCDIDAMDVFTDINAKAVGYSSFVGFESILLNGDKTPSSAGGWKSHLGLVGEDGSLYFEQASPSGNFRITVRHPGGQDRVFSPAFAENMCGWGSLAFGEPATTPSADGFLARGFIFTPETQQIAGVITYIHGGPYEAVKNMTGGTLAEFVKRGYVVVAINFRGSPGYGAEHLEAGFANTRDGALLDAESLTKYAIDRLNLGDKPVYVTGVSWGGQTAIRLLGSTRINYAGGFVQSGVCSLYIDLENISRFPDESVRLEDVNNPDEAIHQMLLTREKLTPSEVDRQRLDRCTSKVDLAQRVVVAHAERDQNAPFDRMKAWSDLQSPGTTVFIPFPGSAHPVPTRPEIPVTVDQIIAHWNSRAK